MSAGESVLGKRKRLPLFLSNERKKKERKVEKDQDVIIVDIETAGSKSSNEGPSIRPPVLSNSQTKSQTYFVTKPNHVGTPFEVSTNFFKGAPLSLGNKSIHVEQEQLIKPISTIVKPVSTIVKPVSTNITTVRPGNASTSGATVYSNKCPSYKWVKGTRFTVDAFNYGTIDGCHGYFLSHFHSDHYTGLNRRFRHSIYCSKITSNLLCHQLKVNSHNIHPLPLGQPCNIDGIEVTLIEANHCPGSVMFLFKLPSGNATLHTGDFRFDQSIKNYLQATPIHSLYLDTTYCDARYDFPCQEDVISYVVDTALCCLMKEPLTLFVCGTYTIGKEKIFKALAQAIGCRVYMKNDKYKIIQCLESNELTSLVSNQFPVSCQVHVLPISKLTLEDLFVYLSNYSSHFNKLLAFKPTGWTFSNKRTGLKDIKPFVRGPVTIYGVPYSEHSSFSELKDFVKFLKPSEIISTVGGAKSRKTSESQCYKWLSENTGCHGNSSKRFIQSTLDGHFTKS